MAEILATANIDDIPIPLALQRIYKIPFVNWHLIYANPTAAPNSYCCYLGEAAPTRGDKFVDKKIDSELFNKLNGIIEECQETLRDQFPQIVEHPPRYLFALSALQIWSHEHLDKFSSWIIRQWLFQLLQNHVTEQEITAATQTFFKYIMNDLEGNYEVTDSKIGQLRQTIEIVNETRIKAEIHTGQSLIEIQQGLAAIGSRVEIIEAKLTQNVDVTFQTNQKVQQIKDTLQTPAARNCFEQGARFFRNLEENLWYIIASLFVGAFIAISGLVASWMTIVDRNKED